MKTNIILAITAAVTGIAYYLIRRKETLKLYQEKKPAHHITNVFAKAKEQSIK